MKHGGIALRSNNSVVVVSDEAVRVVLRKRVVNAMDRTVDMLAPSEAELAVVVVIDLPLVLDGGWPDGGRSSGGTCEHASGQDLRQTQEPYVPWSHRISSEKFVRTP